MLLPGVAVYNRVVDVRVTSVDTTRDRVDQTLEGGSELFIPKAMTFYWYRPDGVTKADSSLARSVNGTW